MPFNVLVSAESRELMQKILASNSSQGEAKPKLSSNAVFLSMLKRAQIFR
jgi:hypothetical protein